VTGFRHSQPYDVFEKISSTFMDCPGASPNTLDSRFTGTINYFAGEPQRQGFGLRPEKIKWTLRVRRVTLTRVCRGACFSRVEDPEYTLQAVPFGTC
jgi:hypothetical protein